MIVRAFAHGLRDFPQTSSDSAITLAEVRGKAAARWLRPFYSRQRTVAGIDLRGLDPQSYGTARGSERVKASTFQGAFF